MAYKMTAADRRALANIQARERQLKARKAIMANSQTVGSSPTSLQNYNDANPLLRGAATVYDIGKDVSTGAVKGAEGIIDFGAGLVGAVGGLFSDDFERDVKSFIETDWTSKLMNSDAVPLLRDFDKYSYIKQGGMIEQISQGVGQMLPAVAVSIATGGAAAPSMLARNAGLLTLGASAAGSGTEEAYKDGASYGAGLGYGALSGATEIVTEKLLPGVGDAIFGKSIVKGAKKEVAEQGVKRVVKEVAQNAINEAREEVFSELTNPARKSIYKGVEALEEYGEGDFWKGVAEAGLVGAGTSVAFGGTVGKAIQGKGYNGDIDASVESIKALEDKKIELQIKSKDGKLSAEDEKRIDGLIDENYKQIERVVKAKGRENMSDTFEKYGLESNFDENGNYVRDTVEATAIDGAYYSADARGQESSIQEVIDNYNSQVETEEDKISVYKGELTSEETEAWKETLRAHNALNKLGYVGKKLVVVDKMSNNNAFISDDVIVIGKDMLSNCEHIKRLVHETTHFTEGSSEWKALAKRILGKGSDLKVRLKAEIDEIIGHGYGITDADVDELAKYIDGGYKGKLAGKQKTLVEELVANRMMNVFSDNASIEQLCREEPSLARKIWERIKAIVDSFGKSSSEREEIKKLRETERMFREALKTGGQGYLKDTLYNTKREKRHSFKGYDEDGRGIYESNFPKGTPKAAKSERILKYIQEVWSKNPIKLRISNGETSRDIIARFDPTIDKTQNTPTDASKLAGGNRHGNHTEQRVTLDLADDYYKIATESTYNYSKLETGKDLVTHNDVIMWHYFINEIYFKESGSDELVPYTVTINVKEKADGEYVYSFNAEKEFSTQRTLHADVNTSKGANGELFLNTIIPQNPKKSTGSVKKSGKIQSDGVLSKADQRLLFDEEFYERYEAESRESITETVEELEEIKNSQAFAELSEDEAYDLDTKLKVLNAGYDNAYDYYVERAKNSIIEEYARETERGRDGRIHRKLKEKRAQLEKERALQRDISEASEHKNAQFEIIQKTNPMYDDFHTGIRSPRDIKTFSEVIDDPDSFAWGDFSRNDAQKALEQGKITVYSSYPIKNGVFVSTSYRQALDYAGLDPDGVHTRTVPLDDVAWINGDEGQFAKVGKVKNIKRSGKSSEIYDELTSVQSEIRELTKRKTELENDAEYQKSLTALINKALSAETAELRDDILREYTESEQYRISNDISALEKKYAELKKEYTEVLDRENAEDEAEKIAKSGLSEADYRRKLAVSEFGHTPYFYDAGYILPDGKMLNFSGEKGQHFGSRGQDHRAIGIVYANKSGGAAMVQFMSEGNIRIMGESPGIDIISTTEPTVSQYNTIRRFIINSKRERRFFVDFTNPDGSVVSMDYDGTIDADEITYDIKDYFKTGKVRNKIRYSKKPLDNDGENEYNEDDVYTEEQYDNFGWAREAEAITFNELEDLYSKIQEKGSLARFRHSANGEAIIEVNNKPKTTLDVDNVFVFVKGNKNSPRLTKVIRIMLYNENDMEGVRKYIYAASKKYSSNRALSLAWENLGNGLAISYFRDDFGTWSEYIAEQRKRSGGSGSETHTTDDRGWDDGTGDTEGFARKVRRSGKPEKHEGGVPRPILNRTRFKTYTHEDAERVISSILLNKLHFNDGSRGEIKNRGELADKLYMALNTAEKGKRAGVALDIAEYIIQHTAMKGIYEDAENLAFTDTVAILKPYLHSFNLSTIYEEMKHRYGKKKANGLRLLWGAQKGSGFTPDEVKSELESSGFKIDSDNEADIFFEIADAYSGATEALKKKTNAMLDEVIPEEERKQLKQDIVREILDGFEILGKPSMIATMLAEADKKAVLWKDQYYDQRNRGKAINHLFETVDRVANIVDMKKADEEIAEEVENLVKLLRKVKTYRGNIAKNVREIMKAYASETGGTKLYDLISDKLDGEINPFAAEIEAIAQGNGELSTREIEALDSILRNFIHNANNYKRVFLDGKRQEATEVIKQGVAETHEALAVKNEGLLGVANKMKEHMQSPVWRFERLGCYRSSSVMVKLWKEFQNGFGRQARFSMQVAEHYKDFFEKHKKEVDKWRDPSYEINGQKASRGQMLGLYLTALRAQGREHLFGNSDNGTVLFTDEEVTAKRGAHAGELEGMNTAVSAGDIIEFEASLTDTEREFIKLTQTFFNEISKNAKVETDEAMYGVSNVIETAYYPLRVADDQLYRKLGDGTFRFADLFNLYSPSFNKKTVEHARNKLVIENVLDVVNRHAKQMANYYGFASAVKTFNRVYNMKIDGVGNMRDAIRNVDRGFEEYVGKLIQDIQGNRMPKSGIQRVVSKVRGWGARAGLGANLKVLATQFVSMPAAAAVGVKYRYVAKGFGMAMKRKTDVEKMFEYVPMLYDRFRNGSNIDVGLLKEGRGILGDLDKLTDITTAPIGVIDSFVCCAVWNACLEQTKSKYTPYSEEHYKAAAELTESALIKTQANYAPLYRPAILRDQDSFTQLLTMFMSEPLQQFSLISSSIEKLKVTRNLAANADDAHKEEYQRLYEQAKKEAAHALTAVFIDTVILTLIAQAFKWIKGKEDEDKVAGIIGDFAENYVGMFPVIKDVYGYIANGYDMTNMAYTGLTNIADGLTAMYSIIDLAASGEAYDERTIRQKARKILLGISQTFGVPLKNLETYLTGIIEKISPSIGMKYDNLFYSESASTYTDKLMKAVENGDDKLADSILDIMLDEGSTDKTLRRDMQTLLGEGLNVLPRSVGESVTYNGEQIVLTKKEKSRFSSMYSVAGERAAKLVKTSLYRKADNGIKSAAIKFIYDTYYNLALQEVVGEELEGKNVLFAEAMDIEQLAIIVAYARSIEADKDRSGNSIAGSKKAKIERYIQSLGISAAEKYMMMGYLGYKCTNGASAVKGYINRLNLTKAEKERLYEYCGYAA